MVISSHRLLKNVISWLFAVLKMLVYNIAIARIWI